MKSKSRSLSRRALLGIAASTAALGLARRAPGGAAPDGPSPAPAPPPFDLEEATIADLTRKLESGEETAKSLCEKYVARIEALDRRGPELRAVLEVNPDALSIAERLDQERRSGRVRGPLHGIPILLKDNIGTADRQQTTAGSLALVGARPLRDSFVARRLREAGAVILGKTNLSEWANFRSTHSSSGWSGRGGQNRNPYALDRTPSGSSSGSGAAAAASFCAGAIGTETDGSIVSPSNNQALVGVKPTLGLVSRAGIIPIAHSQDTAGPMCRTVRDAALLLTAIAGADPADPATARSRRAAGRDYAASLGMPSLSGVRLGVARKGPFGASPAADRLAEEAIALLRRLSATVVDPADVPVTASDLARSEMEVLLHEFKADINRYLASLGPDAPVRNLRGLIDFNRAHAREEMPYFAQELFERAQTRGPLTDPKYRRALARNHRLSRRNGLDEVMRRHRLDALIAPTSTPASLIDLVNGDYGGGETSTLPAVAGYPHVTVPMGFVFGLPVGLSFIGMPWSEARLLALAEAFERAAAARRPPRFAMTADLAV